MGFLTKPFKLDLEAVEKTKPKPASTSPKAPLTAKYRPTEDAILSANRDPIEAIMIEMNAKGYDSPFTVAPQRDGKPPVKRKAVEFDEERKICYLRKLATCGRLSHAAACVGVSVTCVNFHRNKDPVFDMAVREAVMFFKDQIEGEMYRRGVEGYTEEVLGGRNRDQIIRITKYSDRMLELLGRLHIPDLRMKQVEVKGKTLGAEGNTTVINNFDFSSLPQEDMDVLKELLQRQAKRIEDKEKVIEGEVTR
ncbi:hypothetical protein S0112_063 [Shewanella phage S0112]|nr:hypothetical protein S0112_063 [Shewanella phage S0112]